MKILGRSFPQVGILYLSSLDKMVMVCYNGGMALLMSLVVGVTILVLIEAEIGLKRLKREQKV